MPAPKQVERQFQQQVEDRFKHREGGAEQQEADNQQSADPVEDGAGQTAEPNAESDQQPDTSSANNEQPAGEQSSDDSMQSQIDDLRAQLEKAEQRHRTLSGMLRSKDDDLRQMQALISQMEAAPQQQPTSEKSEPSASEKEDREAFGDDFVDMVHRIAGAKIAELHSRLDRLEQQGNKVERVTQQTQQERFEANLARRVPDWRALDATPEFAEWLQQSPTRVAFVQQAMQNFDSDGIAEVFEQYKTISGISGKGPEAQEQPAPASEKLNRKVAPSKGRASTPTPSPEKKVWTRTEIAQAYRNRRNIPDKEFAAMERDIFAAQRENRVDFTK